MAVGLGFSSMGLSMARTSLCLREGSFLYATTGGSGKILFCIFFSELVSSAFLIFVSAFEHHHRSVLQTLVLFGCFVLDKACFD